MPLIKSGKPSAVSANIKAEKAAGKPQRQAVAIALETARRYGKRATGGRVGYADGSAVLPDDWRTTAPYGAAPQSPVSPADVPDIARGAAADAGGSAFGRALLDMARRDLILRGPARGNERIGDDPARKNEGYLGFASGGMPGYAGGGLADDTPAEMTRDILPPRPRNAPDYSEYAAGYGMGDTHAPFAALGEGLRGLLRDTPGEPQTRRERAEALARRQAICSIVRW